MKNIDTFKEILDNENCLNEEEKKALIKVRCNQGIFREKLLEKYNQCPLTGMINQNVLIASHIKPYSKCKNEKEKTSIDNGILLSALADKFFDKGLITFSNYGDLIYSSKLSNEDKHIFIKHLISEDIKINLNQNMLKNMEYHKNDVFQK